MDKFSQMLSQTTKSTSEMAITPLYARGSIPSCTATDSTILLDKNSNTVLHNIAIKTNENVSKLQCSNFVIVIDVSGSMDVRAGTTDADDVMSRLDLVVHSIKTFLLAIAKYNKNSKVSIITYATNAQIDFQSISVGDSRIINFLDNLRSRDTTNIEVAMRMALDLCKSQSNSNIMLFTDGEINGGRKDVDNVVRSQLDTFGSNSPKIYTFGFGSQLDSPMLNRMAQHYNGTFNYINDASTLGSIFCSFAAMVLCYACHIEITINGGIIDSIPGFVQPQKQITAGSGTTLNEIIRSNTVGNINIRGTYNMGKLLYGFTRNILIVGEAIDYSIAVVAGGSKEILAPFVTNTTNHIALREQMARVNSVQKLIDTANNIFTNTNIIGSGRQILDEISQHDVSQFTKDLLFDYQSEIILGLHDKEWNSWGKHYIPSIIHAQREQFSMDFKGRSLQHYGSEQFFNLRNDIQLLFGQIQMRTPHYNKSTSGVRSDNFDNMTHYIRNDLGCYAGETLVSTTRGYIPIKNLVKGEKLITKYNNKEITSVVSVILKTEITIEVELVKLQDGTIVTENHPIYDENMTNGHPTWEFPKNISHCESIILPNDTCDAVYTLILDPNYGQVFTANNWITVGLGHNLTDDDILIHPFWGTHKVIDSLKVIDSQGFRDGYITIPQGCIGRDANGVANSLRTLDN